MASQLNVFGELLLSIVDFPPGSALGFQGDANGVTGRMVWFIAQAAAFDLNQSGTVEFDVTDATLVLDASGNWTYNVVVTSKGTSPIPTNCNVFGFYTDPAL